MRAFALMLICLPPTVLGFSFARDVQRGVRVLSGFLHLIEHVRYEIVTFRTRQADLFLNFEEDALAECGFLTALAAASKQSAHALYDTLLSECTQLPLSAAAKRILTEYAKHLGEYDAEEEGRRADATCGALRECLQAQKAEVENKVRLFRAFGVVASLMLLLMVW